MKRWVSIERPALRKLAQLDWSAVLDDLKVPAGNGLEEPKGDRKGQHSIRVNKQWRVCFVWATVGAEGGEIVAGKRSITADTDLRLCRYFGLSDGWWLRGQVAYDTAIAKESLQKELAGIQRCPLLGA